MFFGRFVVLIVLYTCLFGVVQAQEDLSRNSELPSRIGGPNCPNAGNRPVATVAGSVTVNGLIDTREKPRFSVAVFAGGAFVGRQRVKNGGSFIFYCVPRENVNLVGEVDMVEVSSFSMGTVEVFPAINRQDVHITYTSPGSKDGQRNEVISALAAYERDKENQKQFEKALDEMEAKDIDSAQKRLKRLLEKDPKDFAAWTLLGNIHFNNGRFDDAEQAFERSLALKKDLPYAMIGLGRSLLSAKKYEPAIEVLTSACTLQPNSADANHYLGEAYLQIKKGSIGIVYLRKAIEIAPQEKADLHLRMASLFNNAGAKNLAANEYKLFLQKRPDYPDRQKMEAYISENSQ